MNKISSVSIENPKLDDLDQLETLRSEVNFLIYPFFALNPQDIKKRAESEYRSIIKRGNSKLEILWNVSANPKYGYPGPFAKRVHKAIEQIINEMDPPIENPISFSTYELCKRLGQSVGGRQYRKIKKALFSIKAASVRSKGTFYHKGKKKWVDDVFSLYDRIIFKGEELESGEVAESNLLYLNSFYIDNINAQYIKPLDYNYFKSLHTNVAQRLYELLGVKFFGIYETDQEYIRYKYSTLCQLLPLTRQKFLSYAKRQFKSAHKELQKTHFLSSVKWEKIENEEKNWFVYYFPGSRAEAEIKKNLSQPPRFKGNPEESGYLLTDEQKVDVRTWVNELTQTLKDQQNKNEKFYTKLAKLIVQGKIPESVVWRSLSETKSEDQMRDLDPDKEPIRNRSAYFTDLLKRRLKEKNRDLHQLLQSA